MLLRIEAILNLDRRKQETARGAVVLLYTISSRLIGFPLVSSFTFVQLQVAHITVLAEEWGPFHQMHWIGCSTDRWTLASISAKSWDQNSSLMHDTPCRSAGKAIEYTVHRGWDSRCVRSLYSLRPSSGNPTHSCSDSYWIPEPFLKW